MYVSLLPYFVINSTIINPGAHAQEGYGTCLVCTCVYCVCGCVCVGVCVWVCVCVCVCVCVSVCVYSSANNARFYTQNAVRTGRGFSCFFIIRGFSINPKIMARKSQLQMSSYRSRPVLARFEYCTYISRYLQAAH